MWKTLSVRKFEDASRMASCATLLAFALLLSSLLAPIACAENLGPGGGTRVIAGDQAFGPYLLYITASPEPAVVGTVTFVVRVTDIANGQKVQDAEVTVELTHSTSGALLRQVATHSDAGNPIDYAAHIAVEQAGTWDGVIRVTASGGTAEVTFLQRVSPPRGAGTLIAVGLPFIAILGGLAVLWLARARHRRDEDT